MRSDGSRKRGRPEELIQKQVMHELRKRAMPGVFAFAIPNGGLRTFTEAVRLKAQGVVSGVPDLCVIIPPHGSAHFLELKAEKGRVSAAQEAIMSKLWAAGATCAVAYSVESAISILRTWGALKEETI